jgi:putative endonuclease
MADTSNRTLWMKASLGIVAAWPRRPVSVGSHGGGMTSLTRAEIGALGEQLAVDHLRPLGLAVLTRNWRCRYGELDVTPRTTSDLGQPPSPQV